MQGVNCLPKKIHEYSNGLSIYQQRSDTGEEYARYYVQNNYAISKIEIIGGRRNEEALLILPVLVQEESTSAHIDINALRGVSSATIVNMNDSLTMDRNFTSKATNVKILTNNKRDKLLVQELSIPGAIDSYEYAVFFYVGNTKQPNSTFTSQDGIIESMSDEIKDNNSKNINGYYNPNSTIKVSIDKTRELEFFSDKKRFKIVESEGQM